MDSLGDFKGNNDVMTEKVHSLTGGALRCRFLRFVPLDSMNGGAMRIGVYGEPTSVDSPTRVDFLPEEDLVEYRLVHPSKTTAADALYRDVFASDGHERKNWGEDRRKVLKEETRRSGLETKGSC